MRAMVMGVAAAVTLAAGGASAATVDFDEATGCGLCGGNRVLTADGFTFSADDYFVVRSGDPSGSGSSYKYILTFYPLTMARADGGLFSLLDVIAGVMPSTDNSTLGTTFTISYGGAAPTSVYEFTTDDVAAIDFDGFDGLVSSVTFDVGGKDYEDTFFVGPLEVDFVPAPVPVPASITLLGAALAGLAFLRRNATR